MHDAQLQLPYFYVVEKSNLSVAYDCLKQFRDDYQETGAHENFRPFKSLIVDDREDTSVLMLQVTQQLGLYLETVTLRDVLKNTHSTFANIDRMISADRFLSNIGGTQIFTDGIAMVSVSLVKPSLYSLSKEVGVEVGKVQNFELHTHLPHRDLSRAAGQGMLLSIDEKFTFHVANGVDYSEVLAQAKKSEVYFENEAFSELQHSIMPFSGRNDGK